MSLFRLWCAFAIENDEACENHKDDESFHNLLALDREVIQPLLDIVVRRR